MLDRNVLKMRQAMLLEDKIRYTQRRITEWVEHFGINGVYVSFSGGKDSTVLLHIARQLYPEIKAMFVDTGLEYPEIKQFVKSFKNVDIIRPDIMFNKVIEQYGYPIVTKEISEAVYNARRHLKNKTHYKAHYEKLMGEGRYAKGKDRRQYSCHQWKYLIEAPFKISNQCCSIMKKTPAHKYYKQTKRAPIVGTMAEESRLRTSQYLKIGCNGFDNKIPTSTPIAFWTEQDIYEYINKFNLQIASVYGDLVKENNKYKTTGCHRTGCMFCGFGCHQEQYPNRFQQLAKTHPKQYDYIINKLQMGKVLDYIGVNYTPNIENNGQCKLI